MKRTWIAGLLACFALAANAADPPLPAGVTRGPSVEGIAEYDLANGLRVLFAPDDSKPTTTVNTTYIVGSRHENYGETGMAHLLEHLMFKGTPAYPMVWNEFRRRGLRANGSTWTDRTNYFASFAANDENLEWYLRWSADAMTHSFIAKKDLDSEMTVVRNELELGENDPFRSLLQRSAAAAYTTPGTTTANPPSGRAPTSRTSRSTGCRRSTATSTSPTTRCSSLPASSTRRRRSSSSPRRSAQFPAPSA